VIGDQYFEQVRALLLMNGADNSTTFTDSSLTQAGVVTIGNTKITSNKAVFDGTGDGIRICLPHAQQNFGTDDLCVDLRMTTSQNTQYATLAGNTYADFDTGMWTLIVNTVASNGLVAFYVAAYSTSSPLLVSTTAVNNGVEHHIAITRSGDNWELSVDGASEDTAVWAGNPDTGIHADIILGYDGFYGRGFNGSIACFRVARVSRFTTPFTAPTKAQFYTYAGQFTGPIEEETVFDKWRLEAKRCTDGFLAGMTVTATGSYSIDSTTLELCNITMAPHFDYEWDGRAASVNDICCPSDPEHTPYLFICTVGGATGGSEPTWSLVGNTTDGSATWVVLGSIIDPVSIGPKRAS